MTIPEMAPDIADAALWGCFCFVTAAAWLVVGSSSMTSISTAGARVPLAIQIVDFSRSEAKAEAVSKTANTAG